MFVRYWSWGPCFYVSVCKYSDNYAIWSLMNFWTISLLSLKIDIPSLLEANPVLIVGASLRAGKRVKEAVTNSPFALPRCTSTRGTNANSALAAINKWLKPRVPEGCVVHSLRHALRDRLRAVQCPSDMIDQLGGWATAGVGQSYGQGYSIKVMHKWLQKIT